FKELISFGGSLDLLSNHVKNRDANPLAISIREIHVCLNDVLYSRLSRSERPGMCDNPHYTVATQNRSLVQLVVCVRG
ncbi:hypothetical protein, partial [Escherichia coli]|uniref:hypothetical protein n=1 Tax=Escherichia coli TaxID=562 RepID=UPI003CE5AAB7